MRTGPDLDFQIPDAGSFSLSPSTSQLKFAKNILMRFASDQDSHKISDSSQGSNKSMKRASDSNIRKTPNKRAKLETSVDKNHDLRIVDKDDESSLPVLTSPSASPCSPTRSRRTLIRPVWFRDSR